METIKCINSKTKAIIKNVRFSQKRGAIGAALGFCHRQMNVTWLLDVRSKDKRFPLSLKIHIICVGRGKNVFIIFKSKIKVYYFH